MIICFRCTAETKEHLDRLVESGAYRNYDDAIAAAVQNQVLLDKEVAEKGAIVIDGSGAVGHRTEAPNDSSNDAAERVRKGKGSKGAVQQDRQVRTVSKPAVLPFGQQSPRVGVPEIFLREQFPEAPPAGLADLPPDMWAPGQMIPLDRWMLGQQNRLLPAKVNARALVRLFLDSRKGLPIGSTAERIAAEAAVLGDYLSALDDTRNTSRDDALSTAFPTTAEDAEKGRMRYANQFVVYQNSRGELSGLMADLKLINVLHRKERLIVPTRMAWEFGRLQNPVLDGLDGQAEKFSPEERSLLLRHIATSVPVEAFAYRAILEAVQGGNDTPDKIDAALKAYVTEDRAEKLTPSYLTSQRSGAVSRMSDLGLIERLREGVRVTYAVTDEGRIFLAQSAAAK